MPGTYSVTASLKGFRDVQVLVRVLVGNTTSQDIRLQVGASADTVKVIGEAPLLRPEESSSSTVIDRSLIEELPLNGRKYSNFAVLTPNTSYDGDTGLISIAGQQGGEDSGYANGNGSTYFSVDGSNATNNYFADIVGRNRIPYLFGEDSIQEFQVTVSPYTAIYGGGAGFVTAITRSGSNAFHGSAFYYNRNSVYEANDASTKPPATRNRKTICSNSVPLSGARSCETVYGSLRITSSNCRTIRLPSSTPLCRRTLLTWAPSCSLIFSRRTH